MKVTEKKLPDGKVQLTAVASEEEVERALGNAAYAFAQQMNLRPAKGKTIEELAADQLGIKDLASVVEPQVAEALVPFAINKKNILPAFPPKPVAKSPLKRGETFTFSITVTPRPDYELESYEPVKVTVEPFRIDPREIDNELAGIAQQFTEYVTDDPHPVNSGDSCLIAIEATKDGERLEGLSTEGRTYTTGQGYMPEGFDENVIGMNVGETKSFTFTGPGWDDEGNQVDEVIDCTVTVKEIQKRVIPAITDAWVKKNMPLFRDSEALRGAIRDRIEKGRRFEYDSYVRQRAASELARRFKGRIADDVYEAMQQTMLASIRANIAQQGITFEQFVEQNGGQQQFQMLMMMQIRETLVQGYALDALFRHEGLIVEEEDIIDACRMLNPQQPKAAREQMEQSGRGFALREIAERMKANKWLVEHSEIIVRDPNAPAKKEEPKAEEQAAEPAKDDAAAEGAEASAEEKAE